jgi:hypothetical protein
MVTADCLRPASITEGLLASSTLSIKDLMNLAGYDEKSVRVVAYLVAVIKPEINFGNEGPQRYTITD